MTCWTKITLVAAIIFGYLAVVVNTVYILCLRWFAGNPNDDFMGGFVGVPYLFCYLLSIPCTLLALVLAVFAFAKQSSSPHSTHALAVSLVACALAAVAKVLEG
jgi:hypothetical protein